MNYIELRDCVLAGAKDLIQREEELSRLDAYVGDGDHGVTIRIGFTKVIKSLESEEAKNPFDVLFIAATALADVMGGAIGPILASFYLGMGTSVQGKDNLNLKDLADMFASGLSSLQDLGGAKPGDRTLVDALAPYVKVLQEAPAGTSLKAAMMQAAEAARAGTQATSKMIAKLGRARNLGEKSLGYVDAGATSMSYFLTAFANQVADNA
jgi:phosphoenolpyruvate---glycerone phosphotransferase subunit DhaL